MPESTQPDESKAWGVFSSIRAPSGVVEMNHLYSLSEDEFRTVHRAARSLAEATQGTGLFVVQAMHDLEVSVAEVAEEFLAGRILPPDPEQLMELLNYRVVMLSAAVRMFEEYVLARVSRSWPADSSKAAQIRSAFSTVYDTSLAYRVLYALRNAAVHGAGSMVNVESNIRALNAPDEPKRNEVTLRVTLNRTAFQTKQKIKASVRQEVGALENELSLVLMGREVRDRLLELEKANSETIFPRAAEAIRVLAPHFIRAWSAGSFAPNFHEFQADRPHVFTSVVIAQPVMRMVLQALGGDLSAEGTISVPVELAAVLNQNASAEDRGSMST